MKTSEKVDKILPALAKVKKTLEAVTKGTNNPFFKSKYADLNTYLDEVEPRLEEAGLLLTQAVNTDLVTGNSSVESRIWHVESGQWVGSEMGLVMAKGTMQDAGSAVTYARRYTLGALLSMQAEDDDGNKVSGKVNTTTTKAATPTPAAKVSETVAQVANAVAASTSKPLTSSKFGKNKPTTQTPVAAEPAQDDWN